MSRRTTDRADVVALPTSPIIRAFARVGSERSAIDSVMKLTGRDRKTARAIVRAVREAQR